MIRTANLPAIDKVLKVIPPIMVEVEFSADDMEQHHFTVKDQQATTNTVRPPMETNMALVVTGRIMVPLQVMEAVVNQAMEADSMGPANKVQLEIRYQEHFMGELFQ